MPQRNASNKVRHPVTARGWWAESVLATAALGSVLSFAALPPLSLNWLAWVAPVPWLLLVLRSSLTGWRPYVKLWLAGVLFWLMAIHWLRLPHPATVVGWIALSAYLGCYLPAFIAISRQAVHRLASPLWLAAPLVWTGLELARAHMLTGFLMGSLAHTQVRHPILIQISDVGGEYMVGFLVMLVAATVACCWQAFWTKTARRATLRRVGPAVVVTLAALAATLLYGNWRLREADTSPLARIALIQGNSLADWKSDLEKQQRIMAEYTQLSLEATARANAEGRPLDLIVWPETMFRARLLEFSARYAESDHAKEWIRIRKQSLKEIVDLTPSEIATLVGLVQTPVLLGIDLRRFDVDDEGNELSRAYNAAVLADRSGNLIGQYAKVHLVVFGEYIPFVDKFGWLRRFAPITGGATAGGGPVALRSEGVTYYPNICYESVLPHVIRRQVRELTAAGKPPDVLVNLTNDSWYWGSSELDMHLACDVFRAVEMRTPHVVAANGGISAHIDSSGRILQESPRQTPHVIIADVSGDQRVSLYARTGDWFAGVCLTACGVIVGLSALGSLRGLRAQARLSRSPAGAEHESPPGPSADKVPRA